MAGNNAAANGISVFIYLHSKQIIHDYLILYHIVVVIVHNAIRCYHDKV